MPVKFENSTAIGNSVVFQVGSESDLTISGSSLINNGIGVHEISPDNPPLSPVHLAVLAKVGVREDVDPREALTLLHEFNEAESEPEKKGGF